MESKIEAVLTKFEADVSELESQLEFLLTPTSLDAMCGKENDKSPYVLGAYTLSSMLFAYMRSEGKDTNLVVPELSRVKTRMESLNKPDSIEKVENPVEPRKKRKEGKHIKFDESKKLKKKLKKKE